MALSYKIPLILLLLSASLLYYLLSPAPPLPDDQLSTQFKDKVVLICGASSGIGEELAYQLAGHGAKLVLVARSQDKLAKVKEELLKRGAPYADVMTISYDFSDVAGSGDVIEQTIEKFRRLDYLVSNHGAMIEGPFLAVPYQQDPAFIEKIFKVNVFSHIELALHALPHLEATKGHMFFTSSMAGELPLYRNGIYCSTKHAMNGFFYSLQQELLAKESPVSLTIGAFGLIWTKDLSQIKLAEGDSWPEWMRGSVEDCARGMIESYIVRPRTMSFPRTFNYVMRALWYFNPKYQDNMVEGMKPKGAEGTGYKENVARVGERVELANKLGFQQGYQGEKPKE